MAFRVEVTRHINPAKFVARVGTAEKKLAQEVLKDTDKFVPFQTGALANGAHVDGTDVVYNGPYARYLYHGQLMVDPETGSSYAKKGNTKTVTGKALNLKRSNPTAQAEWFEASKAQNLKKWKAMFAKEMSTSG